MTRLATQGYGCPMWRALLFLVPLVLVGCGGSTFPELITGGNTTLDVAASGGQGTVFTNIDDIRDVAIGSGVAYVATDLGVVVHRAGEVTRITEGLASTDVRAVALRGDGAWVITAGGLAQLDAAGAVTPVPGNIPVGEVRDAITAADNALFACGEEGVARYSASGWIRFGESTRCRRLTSSPDGKVWVGTEAGLWEIEGDIIREHSVGQGLPEAFVVDLVPMGQGKLFALTQGPSEQKLGYYDGARWYGYTVDGFRAVPVGLGINGANALLFTAAGTFQLGTDVPDGARLTALSRGERHTVRSYRADPDGASSEAPTVINVPEARTPLAPVPPSHVAPAAPVLRIELLQRETPAHLISVHREGAIHGLVDADRGLLLSTPDGSVTALPGNDLKVSDLQLAMGPDQEVWGIARGGQPIRTRNGHFVRAISPEGFVAQAIASGPRGAYFASVKDGAVVVYRAGEGGMTELVTRTPEGSTLTAAKLLLVTESEECWVVVRGQIGEMETVHGLVQLSAGSEVALHHHSTTEVEGALRLPDSIVSIGIDSAGQIWTGSLSGATRIGNAQAVTFGGARGLRGEVVSDLVVGLNDRIWFAAAEGPGYREGTDFHFDVPEAAQTFRPEKVAFSTSNGHLWWTGPNGLMHYDGTNFRVLTAEQGAPVEPIADVEVDHNGHVWLLTDQALYRFVEQAPVED